MQRILNNKNSISLIFFLQMVEFWNISDGKEYKGWNLIQKIIAVHELWKLFEQVGNFPKDANYDEKTRLLRLILIQMWHILCAIEPIAAEFRPLLKPLQLDGVASLEYFYLSHCKSLVMLNRKVFSKKMK